jgi:DNA (cytosine-5)-methyltransferase 1
VVDQGEPGEGGSDVLTLGSLFDGIAGFPLAASRHGIKPLWASEIEPFCIWVSQKHFPDMKHLGSITDINGAEIEPVDIITFGSPCQDLSVAGKREGLEGQRSHLFFEAVRIIDEMRKSTGGLYPTYAIWENVPGALSSNNGADFRAVLGAFIEIGATDISWRILDAQHFGVPQRRRRIFLVADFAGLRAGQILFESEGLPGDFAEGREAREEVAAYAGNGVEAASRVFYESGPGWISEGFGCLRCEGENRPSRPTHTILEPVALDGGAVARTLTARADSSPCVDRGQNVVFHPKVTGTLCASGTGMSRPAGMASEADLVVATAYDPKDLGRRPATFEDISPTLKARAGTGGNNIPVIHSVDCRNFYETEELSATLQSHGQSYSLNAQNPVRIGYAVRRLTPLECERLQGLPDNWTNISGASDTARYKAIGNSLAIPCVEWIFKRLVKVMRKEATNA